jgi:hypothetical protein
MLKATILLSLFSIILVVFSFLIRYRLIRQNFIFFIFCLNVLFYEGILYITSYYQIKNHLIANINTLIYFPISVLVLFKIWETVKGKSKNIYFLKYSILLLILIGWVLENFVFKDILVYNSILSAIVSLVLVVVSIYLINVLLFVKNNSILKDSDGLILIGMLIRSFSSGLLLLFMNYRMEYQPQFYMNILILVNWGLIISCAVFLFAIICLPKNRKYTWPF